MLLNLAAKTLLLKVFVELEEDNSLEAHLAAMQRYIRRKRVMGYHKKNYLNLIKLTKKLFIINFNDKKVVAHFLETIKATEPLAEKDWLLDRVQGQMG